MNRGVSAFDCFCVMRLCHGCVICRPLRCGVDGAALDSRLPSPPEDEPCRPMATQQSVAECPLRAAPRGGEGRITRQHHGYPASRPDFFIATKMEVGNATVTERPKQALGFSVASNANFLTKYPETGYRFTVIYDANSLTECPR